MVKIIDIADLWQFKVTTKQYGILLFKTIDYTKLAEVINEIKSDSSSIFKILIGITYVQERNTVQLKDLSLDAFSDSEREEYFHGLMKKQFRNYAYNSKQDWQDNLLAAYSNYEQEEEKIRKKLSRSMKSELLQIEKLTSPLQKQAEAILQLKKQQEQLSFQVQNINSLKTITKQLSVSQTRTLAYALQSQESSIRSISAISSNVDLLNSLRMSKPNAFAFEGGLYNIYTDVYKSLLSSWSLGYSESGKSEPCIFNDDYILPASNAKDVVGLKALLSDISDNDVAEFLGCLEKYPFFASKIAVGKKIYTGLRDYAEKYAITISPQVFYRARCWEEGQNHPFTVNTMWKAPFGKASQGRFNVYGVSYLYLSDTDEIAKKEIGVTSSKKRRYDVMAAKSKTSFVLFDMTPLNSYIFQLCNKENVSKSYTQYLMPNYIAQCLDYMVREKEINIDGIRYYSVHNKKNEKYCNYVLFSKNESDFTDAKIVTK